MMRRLSLFLLLMLALSASAQKRALSILGDSYSTFKDFVRPDTNLVWYPRDSVKHNDVVSVRQTWWHQFILVGYF